MAAEANSAINKTVSLGINNIMIFIIIVDNIYLLHILKIVDSMD